MSRRRHPTRWQEHQLEAAFAVEVQRLSAEDRRPLLAWLYTIARNLITDAHRSHKTAADLPLREAGRQPVDDVPQQGPHDHACVITGNGMAAPLCGAVPPIVWQHRLPAQ